MLTLEQAIDKATNPEKLNDEGEINEIVMWLNGYITDLDMERFGKELAASQHRVNLLRDKTKTVALAEAEFKISEEYKAWQEVQHTLRKFRAYRRDLRDREEQFKNSSKFIRNNFSGQRYE